eukprot:SAG31_NODE_8383_length_1462_cov_1.988261_1_plen_137_part_00
MELVQLHKTRGDDAKQHEVAEALGESVQTTMEGPLASTVEPALLATGCEAAAAAIYYVPRPGTKEKALWWIQQALARQETANRWFKLGLALLTAENAAVAGDHRGSGIDQAKMAFQRALSLDTDHAGARSELSKFT